MAGETDTIVWRLRERREEIVRAIFARVREAVPDPAAERDVTYMEGMREAVMAALDYGLDGIARIGSDARTGSDGVIAGEPWRSVPIPTQALAQARRSARGGVSVEATLQRYFVGHALLWDCVLEEADRVGPESRTLREMSRAQSALLERLTAAIAREHDEERKRMGRSREQLMAERVRALLAGRGEGIGQGSGELEPGYDLDGAHVGAIARGAGAHEALRRLALELDRRLLSVAQGEGTVWAWLGGRRAPAMCELEHAAGGLTLEVVLAVGEPALGVDGFRSTHEQAQAALAVALRRPRALTRYAEVALVASALKDELLARTLIEVYLAPLEDSRGGGPVLRETLRAYLTTELSVSSAAAALGVDRKTVSSRLRTIEERLGRSLHPCPAELTVALLLEEVGDGGCAPAG